jgi:hypothetical protein
MKNHESALQAIMQDPRYLAALDWGQPRRGHPEGTVRAHIAELEENLGRLADRLSEEDVWKLKLLIHTHDTFKKDAERGVAITHPASHASLARAFLAEFCADEDLLVMVQYHDEPFALWRKFSGAGHLDDRRFEQLLGRIRDWNLFLAFQIVDGCTAGKDRAALAWLFEQVKGRVESRFGVGDLL